MRITALSAGLIFAVTIGLFAALDLLAPSEPLPASRWADEANRVALAERWARDMDISAARVSCGGLRAIKPFAWWYCDIKDKDGKVIALKCGNLDGCRAK